MTVGLCVVSSTIGYATASCAEERDNNRVGQAAKLSKLAVPVALRGKWGERGDCSDFQKRMTVTAHTVRFGNHKSEAIFYARHDGPQGQDAIHWIEEGVASNIEYVPDRDVLVTNDMGWGYPGTSFYSRCKPK
jgi:hypothetical protein